MNAKLQTLVCQWSDISGGKALRDWQFGGARLGHHARPERSRADRDAREEARLAGRGGKYTCQEEQGLCEPKG